jgi:hypothetical protein
MSAVNVKQAPTTVGRVGAGAATTTVGKSCVWQQIWRDRFMLLMIAPGLLYLLLFHYVPLLGNIIAFQDYLPFMGYQDSHLLALPISSKCSPMARSGKRSPIAIIIAAANHLLFPGANCARAHAARHYQFACAARDPERRLFAAFHLVGHRRLRSGSRCWVAQVFSSTPCATWACRRQRDDRAVVLQAARGAAVDLERAGWATIIYLAALLNIEGAVRGGGHGWRGSLAVCGTSLFPGSWASRCSC